MCGDSLRGRFQSLSFHSPAWTRRLRSAAITTALLGAAAANAAAAQQRFGPSNLLSPVPIPSVRGAAAQALAQAPLPAQVTPAATEPVSAYVPLRCVPTFGAGTAYDVCHLGAVHSRRLVVLLGDSHAWMWIPGFAAAAKELGFDLVPLTKPGCAVWAVHVNRPGWPCLTWYRGVLRTIARLRPSATVVSFMTSNFNLSQASSAATYVQRVLDAVPHPVLLADPPSDDWYTNTVPTPAQCMATPGANQGTCALRETAPIRASLTQIQAMVNRDGYAAIPTLQWFCAAGTCPSVIDDTVTSEDGSHITAAYAKLLAPRLANQLRPILRRLWRSEVA